MPYIGDSYVVRIQDPVTNITSMTNAALKLGRDTHNLVDFSTDDKIVLRVGDANEVELTPTALYPTSNDGVALGTSLLMWSDLFVASGSVINFNSGDMTITHSSNTLTVAGGTFATAALTATTGVFSGILKTDDSTEATSTTDGSLQTDGGLSVVKDAVFGDDIKLLSDASVVAFGANGDVTLTHVHNTGLLLSDDSGIGTTQLQFGDSGTYIHQSADGVLDLVADTEIEINATTIDINGAVEISGNLDVAGSLEVATIDFTDGDNAITIADTGTMTFPQQVTVTKNIALTQGSNDGEYSGITATFTAGEDLSAGEVVLVHSDGTLKKALSKTGTTANNLIGAEKPAIGVVVADCTDTNPAIVLLNGFMTHNANFPAYNEGSTIYVPEDETSSKAVPEDTAPDTDGDFVQVIGVAVHENRIWVNPDLTVIEVA